MEPESGCKDGLHTHYLLINPKEASFFDIIRFVFSSNLENRKFIDSSIGKEESFLYGLVIVLSVILQKFLLLIAMRMGLIGGTIVYLLNFLHINGAFFGLITNIKQVKVLILDRKDKRFLSFLGFIDMRMDLDNDIKHGNPMYYLALSIIRKMAQGLKKSMEDHNKRKIQSINKLIQFFFRKWHPMIGWYIKTRG